MNGETRREQIVQILKGSTKPVSGGALAKQLEVSRQVIVQDIALLRANGCEIYSTNRGYLLQEAGDDATIRVYKVRHQDTETEEELNLFVDLGGTVVDVFIYHKVYGVMRGELNIRSRLDVARYMQNIRSGKSSLLKNVTSGYHYHTIAADSEETLDLIQTKLQERGFLAKLQDYEPVSF